MVAIGGRRSVCVLSFLCLAICLPLGAEEADPSKIYVSVTLAGNPSGGVLTLGAGGALMVGETEPADEGIGCLLGIETYATDTVQDVVARLKDAADTSDALLYKHFVTALVGEDDNTTLRFYDWPFASQLPFLRTTDAGLDIQPAVASLTATLDEADNKCVLGWSIPPGTTYDSIRIARNDNILAEIDGSATSYTDNSPYDPYPLRLKYFLQYQIVGMKDGRPSDISTVVVQKPVFIATRVLPDGQVGVPYSATLEVVGGITLPITWSLSVSPLPPGLSLDTATGEVSGTPTAAGEYSFGMFAEDSHTPEATVHYRIVDLKITE